jgi:hypothetical protein
MRSAQNAAVPLRLVRALDGDQSVSMVKDTGKLLGEIVA